MTEITLENFKKEMFSKLENGDVENSPVAYAYYLRYLQHGKYSIIKEKIEEFMENIIKSLFEIYIDAGKKDVDLDHIKVFREILFDNTRD